eukprot:558114_1
MVYVSPQPQCGVKCSRTNHGNRKRSDKRWNHSFFFKLLLLMTAMCIFANGMLHMFSIRNNSTTAVFTAPGKSHYSDDIHLFLSCDDSEKVALYTVINSILLNHNTSKSRLHFHILVEDHLDNYVKELQFLFGAYIRNNSIKYEIKQFSSYPQYYNFYPTYMTKNTVNRRLCNQMNYARFYFVDIFDLNTDYVKKAIYLDVDMIVQNDIQILYDHDVNDRVPIQSPHHQQQYTLTGFNLFARSAKKGKLIDVLNISHELETNKEGFNAGIYLYDLHFWKSNNLTKRYEYYVKLNHQHNGKLWTLGTQPIINLLYIHHKIGRISKRWNVKNLGDDRDLHTSVLKRAHILHWNGKHKPWAKDAIKRYRHLWSKYVPKGFTQQNISHWGKKWHI